MSDRERETFKSVLRSSFAVFVEFGFKPRKETGVFNHVFERPRGAKNYGVFCCSDYKSSKPLLPRLTEEAGRKDLRLVVVCPEVDEMEALLADDQYCLVEVGDLERHGIEMVEAKRQKALVKMRESEPEEG